MCSSIINLFIYIRRRRKLLDGLKLKFENISIGHFYATIVFNPLPIIWTLYMNGPFSWNE